MLCEVA